jgi:hypothetical protein
MPVLERMMAKNPKHRYQTPAEVALALQPFIIPPPPPVRDAGWLVIATGILAFLVAGLLGAGVIASPPTRANWSSRPRVTMSRWSSHRAASRLTSLT